MAPRLDRILCCFRAFAASMRARCRCFSSCRSTNSFRLTRLRRRATMSTWLQAFPRTACSGIPATALMSMSCDASPRSRTAGSIRCLAIRPSEIDLKDSPSADTRPVEACLQYCPNMAKPSASLRRRRMTASLGAFERSSCRRMYRTMPGTVLKRRSTSISSMKNRFQAGKAVALVHSPYRPFRRHGLLSLASSSPILTDITGGFSWR